MEVIVIATVLGVKVCTYNYALFIYIYVCKLISKKIQNEAGVIEVCFNGVYMLTKIDSSQVSFFLCLCMMTIYSFSLTVLSVLRNMVVLQVQILL